MRFAPKTDMAASKPASTATPALGDQRRFDKWIALLASIAIALHLVVRFGSHADEILGDFLLAEWPLIFALVGGGLPLVAELTWKLVHREFGSDLLAGISIVTSIVLGEYLAGTLVVLMLSGGEALEAYAMRSASSVLAALARRMPSQAHRKTKETIHDVAVDQVAVGDTLVVFPHEVCPVDGTVLDGHGTMNESFLTGEPYLMPKSSGSTVISGAMNGEAALTIRADKLAIDSRYAQIMHVMRAAEERRPRLRRLGDQLGTVYTPLAVALALLAWGLSGDVHRFLGVLVVATPWFDFAGGATRHHHSRPVRAGTNRNLSHGDLRQDRHTDLRTAGADRDHRWRAERLPTPFGGQSVVVDRQRGAVLEASARGRDLERCP